MWWGIAEGRQHTPDQWLALDENGIEEGRESSLIIEGGMRWEWQDKRSRDSKSI